MATEMGDTLAPTSNSGSGVYGPDTASVEGVNTSKSITEPLAVYTDVHDTNEEILRVSIKGFAIGRWRSDRKGEVLIIVRAGQRKVALRFSLDRTNKKEYVVQSVFDDSSTNYIGF